MENIYNEKSAEIVGIMLGDGSIYAKDGNYSVAVFGHSEDEKQYMLEYLYNLFEDFFKRCPSIFYHKTKKEIRLQITRKAAVEKMIKLGLKPGNKIKNNCGIPKWIFENEKFLISCIRGLVDTDGCVYKKSGYDIPQIEFYNSIPKLRTDYKKAMNIVGIKTGKWRWRPDHSCPACGIYGKSEVFKYSRKISFNNEKHRNRFDKICSSSIVA